jgi:hypothetical protein
MKQIDFDDVSQEAFEAARDELASWNSWFAGDGCGADIHRSVKNAIVAAYNAGILEDDLQQAQPAQELFPERDQTKPAEQQGIFRKFDVRRLTAAESYWLLAGLNKSFCCSLEGLGCCAADVVTISKIIYAV